MRAGLIIWILVVFYSSCGLFKNTKSNVQKTLQEAEYNAASKLVDHKDWVKTIGSVNLYSDSSLHNYAVMFWPKGSFSFSTERGFLGEADSVVILGSLKGGSTTIAGLSTQEIDKGKVEINTEITGKQIIKEKSKVKEQETSWIWVTGIIALVYLLCCTLLYKK